MSDATVRRRRDGVPRSAETVADAARASWCATGWWCGPRATSRPASRRRPAGHQAERRVLRRPHARERWSSATSTAGWSRATSPPSSDTASHAYIYRHMPEVGGVVHTHSTYAVAWAARGEAVPCVLTAMADEFGGEIPVGAVRAHRQRDDRQGDRRRRCSGTAQPGRADGRTTGRSRSARDARGGGQGGRDVRGRVPHGAHRPPARRRRGRSTRRHRPPATTGTRTTTDSRETADEPATTRSTSSRSGSSPGARTCTASETLAAGRRAVAARSPPRSAAAGACPCASCGSRC